MQGVYDNLEKQGKIGPYDAQGNPKPGYRAEYPKWIKLADGKSIIVQSQAEELRAIAATPTPEHQLSPLEMERNSLAEKLAAAEARLAAIDKVPQSAVPKPEPEKAAAAQAAVGKK